MAEVLDRLAAAIVNECADPEEICLQCGIYFKERCLVQDLIRRSCRYRDHKNGRQDRPLKI